MELQTQCWTLQWKLNCVGKYILCCLFWNLTWLGACLKILISRLWSCTWLVTTSYFDSIVHFKINIEWSDLRAGRSFSQISCGNMVLNPIYMHMQFIPTDSGVIGRLIYPLRPAFSPSLMGTTPFKPRIWRFLITLPLFFYHLWLSALQGVQSSHVWRIFRTIFVLIKRTAQLQRNRKMTAAQHLCVRICVS